MKKQLNHNLGKTLPLVSIAIPVLNEAENIENLYNKLSSLSDKMVDRCVFEFVFTDNHSSDNTWFILNQIAASDRRVRGLRFSKNIGFQKSILANYMHTRGEAVVQLDADIQDPPELIEKFFEKWQAGYQVVYGIRRKRKESWFLNIFRKFGYWIINLLSQNSIPMNVGDFRLVDRQVLEVILKAKHQAPYVRGLVADAGFSQTGIIYDRNYREAGLSKFNLPKLIGLGLDAIFNHSTIPLRLASFFGFAMLLMSLVGAGYYITLKTINPTLPEGLASIHVLVIFGIGLNSFLLGIIGEYILRIYLTVRNEPLANIQHTLNISSDELRL